MSAEAKSGGAGAAKLKHSGNQDGLSSKGRADPSSVNKKKASDSSTKQPSISKQKSVQTNFIKSEVKANTKSNSLKATATNSVTKPREKKVYSLPGQKYNIPEEKEPLRIFYESLSEQIPSSEMAEFCMAWEN